MESKKQVVAFLGPKASYTHQATTNIFPEASYKLIPQTSIKEIFATVQHCSSGFGVVPFENSSNGPVVFTLDLFADVHGQYPDILVSDEIYLPVHHCLLGRLSKTGSKEPPLQSPTTHSIASRALGESAVSTSGSVTPTQSAPRPAEPRVKPSHDLSHIKKLYSHPQTWGQCKIFLSTYLKNVEQQDVSSTSKAAELVAQDETGTSAAISSKIAAEMNGLSVLAEGMEDFEGNSTRFFILRRKEDVLDEADEAEAYKSLVSFTVDHTQPGALARCLGVFGQVGLNLTSINSRPVGSPWHYIFFVEFEGRIRKDGEGGAVNEALGELTKVAKEWRWLGSWKAWKG